MFGNPGTGYYNVRLWGGQWAYPGVDMPPGPPAYSSDTAQPTHAPAAQPQSRAHVIGLGLLALLGLLADPVRVRILYALDSVEELCVGDLVMALNSTQDAVGYGLRMLRTAGLVTNRRAGRTVYYRLADEFPEPLREHCLRRLVQLTRRRDGEELVTDD